MGNQGKPEEPRETKKKLVKIGENIEA